MYRVRDYRNWVKGEGLNRFQVIDGQTDLLILANVCLKTETIFIVKQLRKNLNTYISRYPEFATSLEPIEPDANAPEIVKHMISASIKTGVGPMAAVAGAIAQFTGNYLSTRCREIIIENGGDIFLKSSLERTVAIFAGNSPLSGKIGIKIKPECTPLGICTSSGTVGHSLSFGNADAVVVISSCAVLADAAATALGNRVVTANDIDNGLEFIKNIDQISGALIIKDDQLGAWGDIEICKLD